MIFRSNTNNIKSAADSYTKALKACTAGCLLNNDGHFVIANDIWANNQAKLRHARKGYSDIEKDKVLREALFQKLKDKKFDKKSPKNLHFVSLVSLFAMNIHVSFYELYTFSLMNNSSLFYIAIRTWRRQKLQSPFPKSVKKKVAPRDMKTLLKLVKIWSP